MNTVLEKEPPCPDTIAEFMQSKYRSTLVVVGRLPGIYKYSATNRAMDNSMSSYTTITGMKVHALSYEFRTSHESQCTIDWELCNINNSSVSEVYLDIFHSDEWARSYYAPVYARCSMQPVFSCECTFFIAF